ncbi:MAG TPA: hypothetical protein PKD79_01395 [Candidatus Doudnabacteria bacterium]|nr:hypothetical protein [Candidatus Doudnabacteria bacterium]
MFESINWSVFTSSQFWFGIDRFNGITLTDQIILWFGVAVLVLGIILMIYRAVSKNALVKPTLARISSIFITIGLLEMFWFLLRSQFVNTLGTRFAALLVALVGLAFLIQPIRYFWRQYPHDVVNHQRQQLKDKYLQQR